MQKLNKFQTSLLLFFLLWLVFSALYIPYNFNKAQGNKEERIMKAAHTSAVSLQGEMLKELKALPSDVNTVAYLSIKERLSKLNKIDENIVFSYLLTKKDNTIYFLVDSEPIGSADYSAPGDIFYEADEQIFQAFRNKNPIITEPTVDRWGNWVSVLVPIIDQNGEVVAVFGNDYVADNWLQEAYQSLLSSALVSLFVLLLIILLYLIDKNRKSFKALSQNYQRITDNIVDVVWASNLNLELYYVSPSISKLFGDDPELHLNRKVEEKFPRKSLLYLKKLLSEELKNDKIKGVYKDRVINLEVEHYRSDKSIFWAEITVKFIRNKEGIPVGLQGITRDISDRREISNQLKESEAKYRLLSENSPVVVFQFIPDKNGLGYFNYISSQVQKVTGYSKSEFLNNYKLIHSRIASQYLKDFDLEMNKLFKGKKSFKFVMEFKRKDGVIIWLELKALATLQGDGKVILNGVFIDITKEKIAQQKLVKKTQRLNNIIEGANVGTWELNLETKEIIVNDQLAHILGYNSKNCPLKNLDSWLNIIHPEHKKLADEAFAKHLQGKTSHYDYQCKTQDVNASWRWVHIRGKIISFTEDNKALWMFGTLIDINKQKTHEEELHKITKSIEQSPTSIVITNPQGDIEYVNPKFEELTGYSLKEAIGQNPRILKSGKTSDTDYQFLWKTISAGKVWRGEFHNKKKNGQFFWEAASISPVKNSEGRIINYVAVKEDITHQKELQDKLQKSEEQYKTLMANLPGAAFRCKIDKDWTMIFISEHIKKISGYASKELIDNKVKSFSSVILKEDRSFVAKTIKQKIKTDQQYEIEYRIESKDGQIRWVKEKAKIIKEKNKAVYLDGIIYDISLEKKIKR